MSLDWIKIYDFKKHGNEPQQPYTVRTIEVDGKRFCMARNQEGYFALQDICPHAGGRFGNGGTCDDMVLVCPIHRYRFDLKTGKGLQGDYLDTYPVEVRDDGVYVGLKKKWWWPF
jgi:3-phenylpropionate/trans-cinnamate dioxygenase ferredoxin subunit